MMSIFKNKRNTVANGRNAKAFLLAAGVFLTISGLTGCGAGGFAPQSVSLATDAATTTTTVASAPITITKGGTYSGNWSSNDPSVAAVTITTDQPVILQNSTVTGRGDLIQLAGKTLANLTVRNVTGTGLDPQVAGKQRGAFLKATSFTSLVVQNCTMTGTSFGVLAGYGTANTVTITNNRGYQLEDRASDGKGGFLTTRPVLGHFIQLTRLIATNGAEIGWNELKQTVGSSSLEDPINIYLSQGGNGRPILIHDNYMEGFSSTTTAKYTGAGVVSDGDSTGATGWIVIQANQIVHTAGTGIGLMNGHDVTATANRVVSCGKDAQGFVYTRNGETAVTLWNYYKAPNFYNNTITGTTGGMLSVDTKGALMVNNINAITVDASDTVGSNNFTDPCLATGVLNLAAEDAERAYWATKLAKNAILLGDQH